MTKVSRATAETEVAAFLAQLAKKGWILTTAGDPGVFRVHPKQGASAGPRG